MRRVQICAANRSVEVEDRNCAVCKHRFGHAAQKHFPHPAMPIGPITSRSASHSYARSRIVCGPISVSERRTPALVPLAVKYAARRLADLATTSRFWPRSTAARMKTRCALARIGSAAVRARAASAPSFQATATVYPIRMAAWKELIRAVARRP